jgi:predicted regulator of Ras-like GTPase activity (Roadblock/LC7/MglB family)
MEKQVYVFLELERVLTKLKFDNTVSGYALITNDGQPFLSFSLPDEVLPQIQGALRIHSDSLRMMNVMTGEGTVILSRVDSNWVLAVLFSPDLQLGVALQKAAEVISLMDSVNLPPPPSPVSEPELPQPVQVEAAPDTIVPEIVIEPLESEPELEPVVEVETAVVEPSKVEIRHGCVVFRADNYNDTMTLESGLNKQIKERFANLGIDILLMVDEKRTIFKIAESLGRGVEEALNVVRWCVPMNIVRVECPEAQETGAVEIIELPIFEGELKKAKKEHRDLLSLCNGNRPLQDIAKELSIPYFQALQSILPYRGKTLRFIRKTKTADAEPEV